MKKVRFGIIGCGMIAGSHATSISGDDRAELVAVCGGSDAKKLADFAAKYHIGEVYSKYIDLVKSRDIDAVCICTPSGLHGECAVAAAKEGKHILCEKPLDIKADIMTEMINVAVDNHVRLGCVFPNRTRSGLIKAKQILETGELGRMTIVECHYTGYRSPEYYSSSGWKGKWALDGGGCLMNQGIHAIDLMCWLAGEVKSVYGTADTMLRKIEVEDTAMALLEFKSGAKGVVMGTTVSNVPENAPEGDKLRIECELGTIIYLNGKTTLYLRRQKADGKNEEVFSINLDEDTSAPVVSTGDKPENIDMDSHTYIVKDMISAILEDRDPYITGESARRCVDLVLGIYESSRTGRRICL